MNPPNAFEDFSGFRSGTGKLLSISKKSRATSFSRSAHQANAAHLPLSTVSRPAARETELL
jgi:hypothetical protein